MTGIILGEGWLLPVEEEPASEPEVSVESLQAEQLLATVNALREALLNMPPPQVNIDAPDLSAVVNAVNGLRPNATADEIGEAIVARLGGGEGIAGGGGDLGPVLSKLSKGLDTLDYRLKGLGSVTGGGGTASRDIADRAERQLGQVLVTNLPATQPVSGSVTVLNPAPAALTDAQLRASAVVVADPISFYATAAGGRVAFNITSQIVTFTTNGEQPLAALVNPTDSGKDLYIDLGEFGSSQNATFRRYRNGTITPTGTALGASNIGGGSATSAAQMYTGGAGLTPASTPTYTRAGGTVSKTAHIAAYQQHLATAKGRTVLRPGQSLAWTITVNSNVTAANPMTASVYVEFWELAAS